MKLQPTQAMDYCIPLKDGTKPINVRPYKSAFFQKAEIEKKSSWHA